MAKINIDIGSAPWRTVRVGGGVEVAVALNGVDEIMRALQTDPPHPGDERCVPASSHCDSWYM